ncbi:tetrathionate reductase family octaheme c-type cytochrome [Pelagibaculum spongiae]|uniref:Cytochrome C n=1 Tax=Pelagibaculum spongiae TaxID=2080658 RepID=A0A2V1GXH9_9GAMM|nr:tetrathionate reductase family octaheme c-type cytochrome [Pelagibaculum spongiae]PVZ71804.1 cytochrome C [Pelagibaculum spongiae]
MHSRVNKPLKYLLLSLGKINHFFALLLVFVVFFSLPLQASTADHRQFEQLKGPFKTGPDVTKACLECHTEASSQVHKSIHWNWKINPAKFSSDQLITAENAPGKDNIINNFCMAVKTNEARCTSCHAGYGWKDDGFDFSDQSRVDCLACHDTTGKYKKFPTDAGHPNYQAKEWPAKSGKIRPAVDLVNVAQHVGDPKRENCGACHFYGGGGDGVKHGDLDSSLKQPDFELDVHMDEDGLNFSCQNCHTTESHQTAGSRLVMNAKDNNGIDIPGHSKGGRASCESCHDQTPHKGDAAEKLNQHTEKVACETCHIPEFARQRKTKVFWDWSTAGNSKKMIKDDEGYITYHPKKGDFKWQRNVQPEYFWFNGKTDYTLIGEKTTKNEDGSVDLVKLQGNAADPEARIWPFKVMRSVTPRDAVTEQMIVPHLFGKDENAFWKHFNWDKAAKTGMKAAGQPYSGQLEFVSSTYLFPITHMVAPAENALDCQQCHQQKNSRLAKLTDMYLPGRDSFSWLDTTGWLLVLLTLAGVLAHGLFRVVRSSSKEQ